MRDPDQGTLTAIEWGVKNYYLTRSDESLARGLNTSVEEIQKTLLDLGLVRPLGQETMKEAAQQYLIEKTPVEKLEFLKRLDREEPIKLWEMAEGKAASSGEITVKNEPITINIVPQLLKVYGPTSGRIIDHVATDSEGGELASGSSE